MSSATTGALPARTTPFPNRLLDEAMPALRDTEWRLLCVIVRQTLGWATEDGGRKEWDWLIHSQLKARTSRASAAVSQGVEGLVRRHLIEVRDETGELLLTPEERRRARGRLFYRLHPRMLAPATGSLLESGFHKAKTTKENGAKDYLKNPLSFSESEKLTSAAEGVFGTPETGTALRTGHDDFASDPGIAGFVGCYREQYRQYLGHGVPEIAAGEYRLLSRRLEQYGTEELERLLPAFFASDASYIRRNSHSLESFLSTIEIFKTVAAKSQ